MRLKKISLFLIFTLLCTLMPIANIASFASQLYYYGIDVSSGHASPMAVVIGPDEKLYVSEYTGGKITKMNKDGSNVTTFATGFNQPIGLVFDKSGNLYVAEHNGRQVKKIDSGGNVTLVKNINTGLLTGIAIDSNDKLFVVDYAGGKIYKMDLDGSNDSTFLTGLPLSSCIGLAIDENDNLYVSDRTNNKVIKIATNAATSDFITNISLPPWVTLGQDGYFYVSTSSRTIAKYDASGNLIDTFSTSNYSAWGTATEIDGSVFFVELTGAVKKIVGSAETTDDTHITLTMNTTLVGGAADPTAFTVSGVASTPQVSSAVATSGSSIYITLDAPIAASDTSIKISYEKTGTNNVVVDGIATDVQNFSNMPVKNNITVPTITSVSNVSDINVAYETLLGSIGLPTNVGVMLSDTTSSSAVVVWDGGTPAYDGTTAGTYVFSGTLSSSANYTNPNNLKATVNVVVAPEATPAVTAVSSIENITVSNGTALESIGLPASAIVTLSNSTTTSAIVVWDDGTPAYSATKAGTYVFSGTLSNSNSYTNPSNLKANVNVIVKARDRESSGGGGGGGSAVSTPTNTNSTVKINGVVQQIAKEVKTSVGGLTRVAVTVDSDAMDKVIGEAISNSVNGTKNTVEINVSDSTGDSTVIGLNGAIIKKLDQNNFNIMIKVGEISYNIPAKEMTIDSVANKLSIGADNLKDINFEVAINRVSDENKKSFNQMIQSNNGKMVVEPIEFKISATVTKTDGMTERVTIDTFSQFVERILPLSENTASSLSSTGVVFTSGSTYASIPTQLFSVGGINYAKIYSLTNSVYSAISNPVSVPSIVGHWSESTVNKMASKLILTDYKNYHPDQKITRAELADYVVKAMGLYREDSEVKAAFRDVSTSDKYAVSIAIANQWEIIKGYEDGTFKPDAFITREEAMVIYAKVMDVAKYDVSKMPSVNLQNVATWSKPYVEKVLKGKVFNGRTESDLALSQNLTHSEALAALDNLLVKANLINQK